MAATLSFSLLDTSVPRFRTEYIGGGGTAAAGTSGRRMAIAIR